MDRRLDPQSRWNRDRRAANGPRLAQLLSEREELTFDDLLAESDGDVGDVAAWIGHVLAAGIVEEVATPHGSEPRRFRLSRRAPAVLAWERRREAAPRPV